MDAHLAQCAQVGRLTMGRRRSPSLWVLLAALPVAVHAQQSLPADQPVPSMDDFRGVIARFAQDYSGGALCVGGESVGSVRPVVEADLRAHGIDGLPTPRQVFASMATRFPCPFSPYRGGIRAATADDLAGAWSTPPGSELLAVPPKRREAQGTPPLRCEAFGWFSAGEARHAEFRGTAACPFRRADDLAQARALPVVVRWRLPQPGHVVLTRSDVPGHVEEWETFVVESGFEFSGVRFQPGDVLSYQRRSPGNDSGAAARFRHLRKLP